MAPKQEVSVSLAASSWPEYIAVMSFSPKQCLFGMIFQIRTLTGPDVWLPPVVTRGITGKLLCSLVDLHHLPQVLSSTFILHSALLTLSLIVKISWKAETVNSVEHLKLSHTHTHGERWWSAHSPPLCSTCQNGPCLKKRPASMVLLNVYDGFPVVIRRHHPHQQTVGLTAMFDSCQELHKPFMGR